MLSTNPYVAYDQAADKMKAMILLARKGSFREGHLTFVIEGLGILRQYAQQIGKGQVEINTIDALTNEFTKMMNTDEEAATVPSALADLLQGGTE
jgi:hypothetical protein